MTKDEAISKVVDLAVQQIGYKEPKGDNYNKYAAEMDTTYKGWFNGSKDGYDWCAVFVNWLYVTSFGTEIAGKMLNHSSYGTMSAVVQYLYRSLAAVDRVGKVPHVGDIIFYHNDKYTGLSQLCHTGIVWKVEGDYITTIEGNSGKTNTEVATRKIRKDYDSRSWGIYAYGTPDYAAAGKSQAPSSGYQRGHVYKVKCTGPLRIRKEATTDSSIIDNLYKEDNVLVEDVIKDSSGNTWLKITGYAAAVYNGEVYIQ